jgi:uncharacterized ferritin-like protein (DUF455 family)
MTGLPVTLEEDEAFQTLDETLTERGKRYGTFTGHAEISQQLKGVMRQYEAARGCDLDPDQREALEMIAHKIARVINGDPNYADSWHDIAGYAQLIADRLNGNAR